MPLEYLDIDGGRLAIDLQGPATSQLIICSPALADHRDAYAPLASALVSSGYRVACYDLRGHGDSTAGFKHYGDLATADDLLAIIKKYGNGKPAIIIGASLSGGAAVIAAGREPQLVAGLVLICSFLRNPSDSAIVKGIFNLILKRPLGPMMWKGQCGKLWIGLDDSARNERTTKTMQLLQRPGRWEAFQQTVRGADHSVVKPYISKVSAPVLVVMGDKDPDWSDPIAEAKWIASNFTGAESITVNGAGHAPMLEKPNKVTPTVTSFVQRCLA